MVMPRFVATTGILSLLLVGCSQPTSPSPVPSTTTPMSVASAPETRVSTPQGEVQSSTAASDQPSTQAVEAKSAEATQLDRVPSRDIVLPGDVKLKLAWCPAGTFTMGSPVSEPKRDAELEGQVSVTLTQGFWLGETEVTQAQWQSVMESRPWEEYKPSRPQDPPLFRAGPDYPASNMLHVQAVAFCAAVDKQQREAGLIDEGWVFKLPTEAQWEYACRAGATTAYSFGDNPKEIGTYAWTELNGFSPQAKAQQFAHIVRTKQPNPWGLYDMHGNCWEWTADRYHVFTQPGLQGGTDPQGPAVGTSYICRGGGWYANPNNCRSAERKTDSEDWRQTDHGLRLALTRVAGPKE